MNACVRVLVGMEVCVCVRIHVIIIRPQLKEAGHQVRTKKSMLRWTRKQAIDHDDTVTSLVLTGAKQKTL